MHKAVNTYLSAEDAVCFMALNMQRRFFAQKNKERKKIMIKVSGRKLIMPQNERYIGFLKDNLAEKREFLISDKALSALEFRIDIENPACTVTPEKTVGDDGYARLTWEIGSGVTSVHGRIRVQLRALDPDGAMVWHSEICDFFIGNSVDAQSQYSDADLSGFEQIEKKVLSSKLAAQSAADEAKQYAGKAALSASELSSSVTALNSHIESKSNPHGVTKAQLGLGSVDNTSDKNKPVSDAVKAELDKKANHAAVQTAINVLGETMNAHNDSKNNPHSVTKAQIGLSNADNTADKDKPVSDAVKTELSKKADAENLNSHTENTSNPHGVTAEQVGAYGCQEVDNKLSARAKLLHSHRTASSGIRQEINLTERTIIAADISESGRISDKQLYGAGTTFIFDVSGTISIKGTMDSQGQLKNGETTVFRHYPSETFSPLEFEETFTVQKGSSLTLYLSAGKCDFDYFYETSQADGFMTSADKAKLDGLPNDAYSKHETDSKIDLLSLKAEKNGEALRISDACEWEQTADVRIASKNLIPYPYAETTKIVNGITFTDNGDGSITVNGTSSATVIYAAYSISNYFYLKAGTYVYSDSVVNPSLNTYYSEIRTVDGDSIIVHSYDNGKVFTITETTKLRINLRIASDLTVNNLVFRPQLELGTQATAYTPHVSDISSVSVKKYGKNLIPYLYVSSTKTVNGLTFTDNGNGSITVNGTPTGFADFTLAFVPVKPGQTYTLFKNQTGANNISFVITEYFNQSTQKAHTSDSSENTLTFTTSENTNKLSVAIKRTKDYTACTGTFKPQLELGNAVTDYELYKAPVTYTADSDGKVSGVTLGSDTATLMTDTSGVIINAKYKKDITKAFEELETKLTNAILSNGGNV